MQPAISTGRSSAFAALDAQTPKAPQQATEEAFQQFVGETFFGMMLKALRETSEEVPYLDGGQAEDLFRQQLDQTIATQLSESHGRQLAAPLFEKLQRGLDVSV